jgi:hypothetical protein
LLSDLRFRVVGVLGLELQNPLIKSLDGSLNMAAPR